VKAIDLNLAIRTASTDYLS